MKVIGWALWPLILIIAVLGVTLRRLLSYWRTLVTWAAGAFVASFVALIVMTYTGPDKPRPDTGATEILFLDRWWHRLGAFGLTRLLPDHWLVVRYDPTGYPEIGSAQAFHAYLLVAFGASLTVAAAVVAVVFVRCLVRTIDRTTAPFPGGIP